MIELLLSVLLIPIVLVWSVLRLLQDIGHLFGLWLVPAVL